MADYELTLDAEHDLLDIARYTIKTWGREQADRYETKLTDCFAAIAAGQARASTPLRHRPDVRVTRCQHHYVFFLVRNDACPLILAVLHEKMDLMVRLRDRLDSEDAGR